MKLIINRDTWLRGEERSRLLRSDDNKMCCVGFYCKANGYTDDDIRDKLWPSESTLGFESLPESMAWLRDSCSLNDEHHSGLADWNDTKRIPDHLRESAIRRIFADHGVEVTFVN